MGLFGPSEADLRRAAALDAKAAPLEREARRLGATAQSHRQEARRTDRYADPQADRVAGRNAECDQQSVAQEAGQYRSSAAKARTPWWRR